VFYLLLSYRTNIKSRIIKMTKEEWCKLLKKA